MPVAVAVADADDVADELVVAVAEDVAESVAADLVAVAEDDSVAEDDELADELPVAVLVAGVVGTLDSVSTPGEVLDEGPMEAAVRARADLQIAGR